MAKKKASYTGLFFVVLIISFVVGGLSGGLAGLFIGSNLSQSELLSAIKNPLNVKPIKDKVNVIEEQSQTIDVVKKVSPAVVSIVVSKDLSKYYNVTGPDPFPFEDFFEFGFPYDYDFEPPEGLQEVGGGTGFVIDSGKGYILTNKHVVGDEEAEYTVVTNDGEQYTTKVVASDPFNDIAVLQIEKTDLPEVKLGDSDQIEIGQTVIAIGNSLGEYRNTVTKGVISGINRKVVAGDGFSNELIEEAIQTDAAINPGNSGGPLINIAGQVVGVNTAINVSGQLIGFAIPINEAKKLITSVEKHGKFVRPFLGVRYRMVNKKIKEANNLAYDYGALIIRGQDLEDLAIVPESPADKAGLVENDIILEINNEQVNITLGKIIGKYSPGEKINLKVYHDGEEKDLEVVLDEYSD